MSISSSCDELFDLILKWKGKGLRFHLRMVDERPKCYFTEIPAEIDKQVRALYKECREEILRRFTPQKDEKVDVNFEGGDLFSALQKATEVTAVDYDLMRRLDSRHIEDDPPWTWKPCEKTKVPCLGSDGTCFGSMMWQGMRDKAKIVAKAIRQCPHIGRLDKWWKDEYFQRNIKPELVDGKYQYTIDGMSHWEYVSKRKREIQEEVADVLRRKAEEPKLVNETSEFDSAFYEEPVNPFDEV